ncbi:MAG TPA: Gfo/Idh/MocA family oxidoreductase, partial [Vicinamibacterales bacterium]
MDRRDFLKFGTAAVVAASGPVTDAVEQAPAPATPRRVKFAVIGINHSHVQGQISAVQHGGGDLAAFFAEETELSAEFLKHYPAVKQARSRQEILDDPSIHLIVSAAIPSERAALAAECMRHGKDFCVDKPGVTTLEQLAELRKVQADTRRIFSVLIERHESKSTQKAIQLVKAGAVGRIIQTLATAPHKMSPATRPAWFFQRARYGGILVDLASHHVDEFIAFTGS